MVAFHQAQSASACRNVSAALLIMADGRAVNVEARTVKTQIGFKPWVVIRLLP